MKLMHFVTMNVTANDYGCVMVKEDADGFYGISLCTYLIDVAGGAVRKNMATLGPKVLPINEFEAYSMICIKVLKIILKPCIPNFKLAFQHFFIHPWGRTVINGIRKNLQLTDYDLDPSRMALYWFGNTSTNGLWYEENYTEAKRWFRVGYCIWKIALDSTFKCNSVVWKVLKETHPLETTIWDDHIH